MISFFISPISPLCRLYECFHNSLGKSIFGLKVRAAREKCVTKNLCVFLADDDDDDVEDRLRFLGP